MIWGGTPILGKLYIDRERERATPKTIDVRNFSLCQYMNLPSSIFVGVAIDIKYVCILGLSLFHMPILLYVHIYHMYFIYIIPIVALLLQFAL